MGDAASDAGTDTDGDGSVDTDAGGDANLDAFDDAPEQLDERLDLADLPPPQPLTKTLEAAEDLDDGVLLQTTDRVPQHLYPELEDRGFAWETVEGDDAVHTAIWRQGPTEG